MKQLLILGNGISRLNYGWYIREYQYPIWSCNSTFRELYRLGRIDVLGSVHGIYLKDSLQLSKDRNFRRISVKSVDGSETFHKYHGYSTGNEMIHQAIYEGYDNIDLLGFDMGGFDITSNHNVDGTNFKSQFTKIQSEYPYVKFNFINKSYIETLLLNLKNTKTAIIKNNEVTCGNVVYTCIKPKDNYKLNTIILYFLPIQFLIDLNETEIREYISKECNINSTLFEFVSLEFMKKIVEIAKTDKPNLRTMIEIYFRDLLNYKIVV